MTFIKILVYLPIFLLPIFPGRLTAFGKIIKRQSTCNFAVQCPTGSYRCRQNFDCRQFNQICCSRNQNSGFPIVDKCCVSLPVTTGPITSSTASVSSTTLNNPSSTIIPSVTTSLSTATNPSVSTNPSTGTSTNPSTAASPSSSSATTTRTTITTTIRPGK